MPLTEKQNAVNKTREANHGLRTAFGQSRGL
jgi:hypothetical protein